MVSDFIFSSAGDRLLVRFKEQFDCDFRFDEPSGHLVMDIGEDTYRIPESVSAAEWKRMISESIDMQVNLLLEQYRDNAVQYEPDVDY